MEDWQAIVIPPNVNVGTSECDEYVNRHFYWQLLAWGGNVDASPIVDHGLAYSYMVNYASKGESRSKQAKRVLTHMVSASAGLAEDDPDRLSLQQILRRTLQTCATRRDMGAQEDMHLLLQTPSVHHDLETLAQRSQHSSCGAWDSERCRPQPPLRPEAPRSAAATTRRGFHLRGRLSMIAQAVLGLMSIRCKQAVEGRPGDHARQQGLFGGVNPMLVGDPMQLSPIGAAPEWNPSPASEGHTVEGLHAWTHLNAAVELTEVRRQQVDDQAAFRRVLSHVAQGFVVKADWQVLREAMRSRRTVEDAASFDDDVHIFPTNAQADAWNWERLRLLGIPIARVNAEHTLPGFRTVPADRFRVWRRTFSSLLVLACSSTTTFGRQGASLAELWARCSAWSGRLTGGLPSCLMSSSSE